ncbi:hypothetical protein HPB50_010583 [Hyalomma asiaticum]|uniref:Uncharacterized protein n=1 Tax=Hyalomma asiaticum TaxID=266040 RepID=A0ACB7SVD3_HYAAI|nr:hypothetical protein HPB50_010583 [Hyalomma asiaticum]
MTERASITCGGLVPEEPQPAKHSGNAELADLRVTLGCFSGCSIEPCEPCTAGEDRTCRIVRKLSVWNELLCQSRLELRESSSRRGQFSLVSFEKPWTTICEARLVRQAVTLACRVLNTHHCVATLDVSIMAIEPRELGLLVGELRGNVSVKVLKFRNPRFASGRTQEDICRLISSLHGLEELECPTAWKCPVAFLDVLSELLRTTTCLEVLRIPMVCIKSHGAEKFLEALARNRTLKELSLDESFIGEASLPYRVMFAEYLKNNTTLKTLAVLACNKMQDSLKWILEGLLGNRTVSKVNLTNFVVDSESAKLVPIIFAKNETISSFNMISMRQDSEMQDDTIYENWLETLKENETLKTVRLPCCAGKLNEWESLFKALPTKANLKLTIEWNVTYYHFLPKVCSMLRDSGAEERVCFETNFPPNNADMLEYKGFSDIFACLRSDTRSEFSRIMHKLPSAIHVTSVQLGIWMHAMDAALSSRIANYLKSSTTLKKLHLIFTSDPSANFPRSSFWADIVTSLSQNVSIKELHVKLPDIEDQDTGLLAEAIKSSKNIQRVYFVPERSRDASCFFGVLSEGIRDNHILLSVTVDVSLDDKEAARNWFVVWDTMRRNSGRLMHAALFVTGNRCDRACAEALEWMHLHPALPEQVADLSSVTEAEAIVMIRHAVRSLENMHYFMRLAGVVSQRVSCLWREEATAQLSDLNEDCWRRVRGYLRLSDVAYPTEEK